MSLTIGIYHDAEVMERVQAMLAQVPKGVERAYANAINRGLSKMKTEAFQEVKQVYAVKSAALNEATDTHITKASTSGLAGYIQFSGHKIPLYKFSVTPKKPGTKKLVKAAMKRGGGAVYESAFIAEMPNGHIGVFRQDKTKKRNKSQVQSGMLRYPISEYMGLSAVEMVSNVGIVEKLQEEARKAVNERVLHEVERILNGYGG